MKMEETKLFTTAEVAERLGVTTDCIRKWDESGVLKHDFVTEGGHRRYTEENIEKYQRRKSDESKVWNESELTTNDVSISGDKLHTECLVWRDALCPECGGSLVSDKPKMYNPFDGSSMAVCKCRNCGKTFRTEHAYPRGVVLDRHGEERLMWM